VYMIEIIYEISLCRSVRYVSPKYLGIPIICLEGHLFHDASSEHITLINKTNHIPAQVMLKISSMKSVLLYI